MRDIRETSHVLADLLDGLGVGLCAFDRDDRALVWNRTFLRFFPEHDGHVSVGEPYGENLRRFYGGRLSPEELVLVNDHIASGIARHRTQTRPFTFEHRGRTLRVSAQDVPGLGRARTWIDVTAIQGIDEGRSNRGTRQFGDEVPEALVQLDENGRIVSSNESFVQLYRLGSEVHVPGLTFERVLEAAWRGDPESGIRFATEVLPRVREAMRFAGAPFEVPLPEDRWVRVLEKVDGNGRRTSAHVEVTLFKREEARLRAAKAHLRSIIEHAPGGIVVAQSDGLLLQTNRAFRRMLLVEAHVPARLSDVVHPDDGAKLVELLRPRKEASATEAELRFRRPDGSSMWAHVSVAVLAGGGPPTSALIQVNDVTARREGQEKMAHMARHDALTGLPNRAHLEEHLEKVLGDTRDDGGWTAVMCVDLDHFKAVNDTLGHLAGDELLRQVASRLSGVLRPGDLMARLGGDEFVAVLPGVDRETLARIAGRMLHSAQEPLHIQGRSVQAGISVGCALAPDHGLTPKALLGRADVALYQAKAGGRNAFKCYTPAMERAATERQQLALDLGRALERGEFTLHYQPMFLTQARRLVGFEALARWRHATRGDIPPSSFIPLAEEAGLIDVLGAWVLGKACRDAVAWPDHLCVAVNVSPQQVRRGNLPTDVQRALRDAGLSPGRLELEITEEVLTSDGTAADDLLGWCDEAGVNVTLDDFGTGLSSLNNLRRFNIGKLKVDRSCIADLQNPVTAAIVRAAVSVARHLGATVVAEGVETEEELALVRREEFDGAQGFLLGRPRPLFASNEVPDRLPHRAA